VNEHDLLQIITAEGKDLDWWQMGFRAVLVYISTLVIVRLGKKRLFGKSAAMDVVLGVILGSVVSRSINGGATLLPTAGAALVLVALHALSAKVALISPKLGILLKGHSHILVKDGKALKEAMNHSDISQHDLEESLRVEGKLTQVEQVAEAHLERNGKISIIPVKKDPKILDVKVENGVQTVRIEVG
jgi:uncharacterized membrane protein YcaP (DUF421 family)